MDTRRGVAVCQRVCLVGQKDGKVERQSLVTTSRADRKRQRTTEDGVGDAQRDAGAWRPGRTPLTQGKVNRWIRRQDQGASQRTQVAAG